MTELEKYAVATIAIFLFLGLVAFLSQLIPALIQRALGL